MSAGAPKPVAKLQFFLRSGGSFVIDGVEEWKIGSDGNSIASLELRQQNKPGQTVLQIPGIALSEIAAIVRLPLSEPGAAEPAPAPSPSRAPRASASRALAKA
ncbi:hypothetical protein DK419_13015 [Methylobacterium terrae]|uniref:Uncharacterized protein n=1 Tax=Methylobacterium terrae TaxID=2202827 RepID=A0A2U8WLW1_9HYPH|nr:hypothetical protein [Methylobacterium terrae]AWN47119.1 hypothetical protein DK419_13015 [Methylobacterium terrae]